MRRLKISSLGQSCFAVVGSQQHCSLSFAQANVFFDLGFGLAGIPGRLELFLRNGIFGLPQRLVDTLLEALAKRGDVTDLTGVSNNAGASGSGLGVLPAVHLLTHANMILLDKLLNSNQLTKVIASYPGG
jgi:hypothetical protein